MLLMVDDIKNMIVFVKNFAICKVCIKKFYKVVLELDKLCFVFTLIVRGVLNLVGKRFFTLFVLIVIFDERLKKLLDYVKDDIRIILRSLMYMNVSDENLNGIFENVVLIGFFSRGVYVKKEKLEVIKINLSKRFVFKLFELVFGREEVKDGSVEGKGEKLFRLDFNRFAVI